jgi:DNA-directed RNA polymerase specialized sigma24 family protein
MMGRYLKPITALQARILFLRDQKAFTFTKIGELTGVTRYNAWDHYTRASAKLQKLLDGKG